MNLLHTPLPHHYLAKLYYKKGKAQPKLIDSAYFTAKHDVNKTAYNALGIKPRANYMVEIRRVTPHELGMITLEART